MPSARDVAWSLLICFGLTFMLQWRPSLQARSFIERDSRDGFYEAYAGHRFVSGELISVGGAARVDPMASAVSDRRLQIQAERISWNGSRVEFVVRHRIELAAASAAGDDVSQDVHLKLQRDGTHWAYTLFEVRGHPPLNEPNTGNPWARALREASPAPAEPPHAAPD